MHILLVSTYELGHQPFGLASPAAWLAKSGHEVACADLCIEALDGEAVRQAGLIAFYLPMHTATRLAAKAIEKVRGLNPAAHICCYGLYAPLNEEYLRSLGVGRILGGEFEPGLVALAEGLKPAVVDLARSPAIPGPAALRPPAHRKIRRGCESTAKPSAPATPKPAGAANICAAIARWCRCIKAIFEWSSRRSCSPTFASRSPPEPSTSPSAIPISSTAPRTRCGS